MALGARLKIRVATPRGPRDIHATVSSGGSYGRSTLQQEIGLGDATAIEAIEVTWPATGTTQVFRGVAMDQFVGIREGDASHQYRFVDARLRCFGAGHSWFRVSSFRLTRDKAVLELFQLRQFAGGHAARVGEPFARLLMPARDRSAPWPSPIQASAMAGSS